MATAAAERMTTLERQVTFRIVPIETEIAMEKGAHRPLPAVRPPGA